MQIGRRDILRFAILIFLNLVMVGLSWRSARLREGNAPASLACAQGEALAAYSERGASGEEVRRIQERLIRWGYLSGEADGIYGPQTEEAVRYFQRSNGLAADGIAGPDTLAALGLPAGGTSSGPGEADYQLLARIISAEARGEPYEGQVAVGAVVLNRVEHPSFPDSIAGVIYQAGAFTAVNDGQFQQPVADSAYRAAKDALNGWDPSGGALYYYNPDKTSNAWMRSRPVILRIGAHLFCS